MEEERTPEFFRKRIVHFENYFSKHIDVRASFEPELLATQKINSILRRNSSLTLENAEEILNIISETDQRPHYDGTGWYDLKLHLRGLFKSENITLTQAEDKILWPRKGSD